MNIQVSYAKDDDGNDVAQLNDGKTQVNLVALGDGDLGILVSTMAAMAAGCGSLAQAAIEYQHRGYLH